MELTINHPEINQLTQELMRYTGETLTQTLLNSLQERLKREKEKRVDISEAQKRFVELIQVVQSGTVVIIMQNNQPLIRLTPIVPLEAKLPPRVLGLHNGQGWMSDDFNDPLPDSFWLGEA